MTLALFSPDYLCDYERRTRGEPCHQNKYKRSTGDSVDSGGLTGPFIHAVTLPCTAEAPVRSVYTANPSLHCPEGVCTRPELGGKSRE